jgi:hypothetical protein
MASNVPITPGSGAVIKTDDVGGGEQVQYIKLDLGVTGASSPVSGSVPITGNVGIVGYDGATTRPILTDTSGRTITVARLQDGSGTAITSTLVGAKQRLDVTLGSGVAPGATAPAYMDVVGGTDGSLARAFLTDTSGRQAVRADAQRNTTAGSTDYGVPALGVVQDTRASTGVTDGNYGMPRLSNLGAVDVRVSQGLTATNTASSSPITLVSQDCNDYNFVSIQILGTFVATVTFQVCNDNSNWVAYPLQIASATASSPSSTATTTGIYVGNIPFRYFRAQVTAWTSGTVTCVSTFKAMPASPPTQQNVNLTQQNSSSTANGLYLGASATSNGTTALRLVSAASTNLTAVKASAGRLIFASFTNTAAYAVFVKFYNIASGSVTVGTSAIAYTFQAAAGVTTTLPINDLGIYFSNAGWSFSITKLAADSDTTVVVAGDLLVHLAYA